MRQTIIALLIFLSALAQADVIEQLDFTGATKDMGAATRIDPRIRGLTDLNENYFRGSDVEVSPEASWHTYLMVKQVREELVMPNSLLNSFVRIANQPGYGTLQVILEQSGAESPVQAYAKASGRPLNKIYLADTDGKVSLQVVYPNEKSVGIDCGIYHVANFAGYVERGQSFLVDELTNLKNPKLRCGTVIVTVALNFAEQLDEPSRNQINNLIKIADAVHVNRFPQSAGYYKEIISQELPDALAYLQTQDDYDYLLKVKNQESIVNELAESAFAIQQVSQRSAVQLVREALKNPRLNNPSCDDILFFSEGKRWAQAVQAYREALKP